MARNTGVKKSSSSVAASSSSRSKAKREDTDDEESDHTAASAAKKRRKEKSAKKRRGEKPSSNLAPSVKSNKRQRSTTTGSSIAATKPGRGVTTNETPRGVKLPTTFDATSAAQTKQSKQQFKKEESHNENDRYERHGRVKLDPNSDRFDTLQFSDQEKEALIAFCCHKCTCSRKRKSSVQDLEDNAFIQSEAGGLYHRRCCHKQVYTRVPEMWCTAIERANNEYAERDEPIETTREETADISLWKRLGTQPPPDSKAHIGEYEYSIPVNPAITNSFNSRQLVDHAAVVLDLSDGIGGGILALMRSGVALDTIIRPEVDRVASHVYKWHHDANYLSKRPKVEGEAWTKPMVEGGIRHVYVPRTQYAEDCTDCSSIDWNSIAKTHGNVDIVLAGPVFLNYQSGDDNDHARLLRIRKIADTVSAIRRCQAGHPMFVLVEVAALRHGEYVDLTISDKDAIQAMLCLPGCIEIDSKFFCPVARRTTWFTDVAPGFAPPYDSDAAGRLYAKTTPENGTGEKKLMYCNPRKDGFVRFCGFIPNHSSIDSVSNLVFLEPFPGKGHPTIQRPLDCREREALLGYPAGFVHTPVHDLFTSLVSQGFGNTRQDTTNWRKLLPTEYHIFGKCGTKDVKFDSTVFPPGLELPAYDNKAVELLFFDEHKYACRLIAAAPPMPVLDIVLSRLSTKFPSKEYTLFNYAFRWEQRKTNVAAGTGKHNRPIA